MVSLVRSDQQSHLYCQNLVMLLGWCIEPVENWLHYLIRDVCYLLKCLFYFHPEF